MMDVHEGIRLAWTALGLLWLGAAFSARRPVRLEPANTRIGHMVTFAAAFALLFWRAVRIPPLNLQILPPNWPAEAAGFVLTIAGITVATWARFYLGGNWSSVVAIKEGHTLVRSGPYRLVRHPIYAGLLLAMLGTAIVEAEMGAFLGVVIAFAGWLAKARLEDSFLLEQFGDVFLEYRRRAKAIIPFVL
jgi:protein-S-isoprenylcysteine O-methyltransferase Ste14